MADKVLIILLCTAIGLCFGRIVYKKYVNQKKYYEDLLNFIEKAIQNLGFKQESTLNLVNDLLNSCSGVFVEQLSLFKQFLTEGKDMVVCSYCDNADKSRIYQLFTAIGSKDIDTERANLQNEKVFFNEKLKIIVENLSKKGIMALKLLTLAGLVVGILLA